MFESSIEMFVHHNGKMIKSSEYRRVRLLELLTPEARILLDWLKLRGKQNICMSEINKTVTPLSLRKADTIRKLMNELLTLGLLRKLNTTSFYHCRKAKEAWELKSTHPLDPWPFTALH